MSTHPREPFDAEEARIKRAYDALPQGEPSAALDARVLAQARGAVAASRAPKRRRPWFLGAGLGTAAAAVFAAGIAWQLGVFEGDRNLSTVPVEAPAAQEELDRIDIEFMKQEHKKDEDREQDKFRARPSPPAAPAPPAPPPGALRDAATNAAAPPAVLEEQAPERREREAEKPRQQAATPAAEVMAESQAFPPEPAPVADMAEAPADAAQAGAAASSSAGQLSREDAEGAGRDARSADAAPLGAVAGARPEPAANAASPAPESASSFGLAKEIALPPWAEDVKLAPDAWLERIRDRVQQGDRQGAEHSLRRFVLEHPAARVPRDLQRLLVE